MRCHLAGTSLVWSQVTLYYTGALSAHRKGRFGGRIPVKICIANCGQTVTDNGMVTTDWVQELSNAQSNGTIAGPTRLPVPHVRSNAAYCQMTLAVVYKLTGHHARRTYTWRGTIALSSSGWVGYSSKSSMRCNKMVDRSASKPNTSLIWTVVWTGSEVRVGTGRLGMVWEWDFHLPAGSRGGAPVEVWGLCQIYTDSLHLSYAFLRTFVAESVLHLPYTSPKKLRICANPMTQHGQDRVGAHPCPVPSAHCPPVVMLVNMNHLCEKCCRCFRCFVLDYCSAELFAVLRVLTSGTISSGLMVNGLM